MLPERPATRRTNTTSRDYRPPGCVTHDYRRPLTSTDTRAIRPHPSSGTSRVESLRETYFPDSVPTGSTAILAELAGASWYEALHELIDARHLPRALVCENDQRALEVLDALTEKGVSVPGDVIVTGFDGILAGRLSSPTLTTVRQPLETMGRLAARLLTEQAASRDLTPTRYVLPLQPHFRGSCGCSDR